MNIGDLKYNNNDNNKNTFHLGPVVICDLLIFPHFRLYVTGV